MGSEDLAMPPQPITRIIPNHAVDFDPVKLASVPHLTALPMAVIAIWGAIDGHLAKMLSRIVDSDFAIVVAIFSRPLRGFIADFNGFDGFRSQNRRVRANIRRQAAGSAQASDDLPHA